MTENPGSQCIKRENRIKNVEVKLLSQILFAINMSDHRTLDVLIWKGS